MEPKRVRHCRLTLVELIFNSMLKKITVKTSTREEFIDVTSQIQEVVSQSGVSEGFCFVYVPHTTAAVIINENADPSVKQDIINQLAKVAPYGNRYLHTEGNADAHIKASLVGSSVTVLVENRRLALGTWQGIFFCEFDGPRTRELLVKCF